MRKLIFRSAAVALAFLGVAACTSGHEQLPSDSVGQSFDPIVNGTMDSGTANDAVVLIYNNAIGAMCTGAIIAKNLVLTARHCVSSTTETVDCYNDVISDSAASQLYIYKGVSPDPSTEMYIAQGKAVFHDTSKNLCGHDISIIQTSWNIVNITPLKVRVHKGPSANELFKAIGYGLTNPNNQASSGTRYYRNNVRVLGLEPQTSCQGANNCDFVGTESICSGDSGGPAISGQGAVMGVTSRGYNCYADDNIWTRTDPYKWLLDQAAAAANSSYTGEDGTVYGSGGTGGTGGTGGSGGSGGSTGGSGGSTGGSGGSTGGSGGSTGGSGGSTGGSGGSTGGSGGSTGGFGGSTGGAGGSTGGFGGSMGGDGGAGGSPGIVPGGPCGPNNDCGNGLACVQDFGGLYCAPACDQNGACPTGWACAPEVGYCFKNKLCVGAGDCAVGTVCAADPGGNYCTPLCDANNPVCPSDSTCSAEWGACFRNAAGAASYDEPSTASGCAFSVAGSEQDSSNLWWLPIAGLGAALMRRRRRGA